MYTPSIILIAHAWPFIYTIPFKMAVCKCTVAYRKGYTGIYYGLSSDAQLSFIALAYRVIFNYMQLQPNFKKKKMIIKNLNIPYTQDHSYFIQNEQTVPDYVHTSAKRSDITQCID